MKKAVRRFLVALVLAPVLLGGAFGHVDGSEALSRGTFLFAPDHPAHAPFVPQKEHACASCAVTNLVPPASALVFLVPPASRPSPEARADRLASAPILPEFSGRSPPSAA